MEEIIKRAAGRLAHQNTTYINKEEATAILKGCRTIMQAIDYDFNYIWTEVDLGGTRGLLLQKGDKEKSNFTLSRRDYYPENFLDLINQNNQREEERRIVRETLKKSVEHPSPAPAIKSNSDEVFTEKTYLVVDFEEREAAKKAGAMWDKEKKSWYAPENSPKALLSQWTIERKEIEAMAKQADISIDDAAMELKGVLEEHGFIIDGLPEMHKGKEIIRVGIAGKKNRNNKDGWYQVYSDGRPNARFGDHSLGENSVSNGAKTWVYSKRDNSRISQQEIDKKRELNEKRREEEDKRYAEQQSVNAQRLQGEFFKGAYANASHQYLSKKGVDSHFLRTDWRGNLMIPLRDVNDKIWNVQRITPDGFKFSGIARTKEEKANGVTYPVKKKGTFFVVGAKNVENLNTIIIAEGYATAASIYEALKYPVVMAIDSGNLLPVAEEIKAKFPDREFIFASDNDVLKTREGKENVGLEKAQKACETVGGRVISPQFSEEEILAKATDFNDLSALRGKEAIKEHFSEVSHLLSRSATKDFQPPKP